MLGNRTRLRRTRNGTVEPLHLEVVDVVVRRLAVAEDIFEELLQVCVVDEIEAQSSGAKHLELVTAANFDSADQGDSFEQGLDFELEVVDVSLMVTKDEVYVSMNERLDVVGASVWLPRIAEGQGRTELPCALARTITLGPMIPEEDTSDSPCGPARQVPSQARTGDETDPNRSGIRSWFHLRE